MISTIKSMLFISLFVIYTSNVSAESHPKEVKLPGIQSPSVLIESLKGGNHIIYMRHGFTESKSGDVGRVDLTSCEAQRNLSEAGLSQVRRLGASVKSLNIPIGQVKSSPYCRTKATAQAVFGEFEVDEKLRLSLSMSFEESRLLGQYLLESMLASNDVKKNTVYVGHTANLKDGLDIWPEPEGVMVIFKKEGNEVIFKGVINPDDWPKAQ